MDLAWNITARSGAYASMSVLDLKAGEDFAADWAAWHKKHEDRLNAPDGFLAITSINWLTEIPARFPDAPGEWAADDSGVTVDLAPGEELTLDGTRITGRHSFDPIPERGGALPVRCRFACVRGGQARRERHPAPAPSRHAAAGRLPRHSRVRARPALGDPGPLPAVRRAGGRHRRLGGRRPAARVRRARRGRVRDRRPAARPDRLQRLRPWEPAHPVHRRDKRCHHVPGQPGRCRSPAPGADGTVVLDFNRATNLPCAYTDFATCPLPPAGNRLPVPVEAGEQIPYEAQAHKA